MIPTKNRPVATVDTLDPAIFSSLEAGFDTRLDYHPLMLQYRPRRERAYFLAPIAVSRYEGIRQCAASASCRSRVES